MFQDILQTLGLESSELIQIGLRLLGIWGFAWLGWRALRIVAVRIVKMVDDGDDTRLSLREKRGQTIAQLLRNVGGITIFVIAVMLTFDIFIDIGPLLAGAGIIGLAVSFGAQSLVKDVISGFFIIFEDQFAVGDIVEIGGVGGVVERITLRVVVLRDIQGQMHIVPNGQITNVINKTRGWARSVQDIGIAYDADVNRALEVFRDEAARFARDKEWLARFDGEPEVWGVENLGDSSVVIRTVLRTRPGEQWNVGREFRRRIKNRLDAEGIEIPFPQRTVHLRREAAENAR